MVCLDNVASFHAVEIVVMLKKLHLLLLLCMGFSVTGCGVMAVAGATAGAAISVAGAVVSTGVKVTGKVIEKTIDVVTPSSPSDAKP
jgi:hypothetical protein